MDPRWKIKKDEWSEQEVSAFHFFEEARILFVMEEIIQMFPVVLEYYRRNEIRQRLAASTLRTARGDFHIRAMTNYLEESPEGVFVIERHVPPDLSEDRAILLTALENLMRGRE